jgi:integrase
VRPDRTGRKTEIRWRYRGDDYRETLDIEPSEAGLAKAARILAERRAVQKYGPSQVLTSSFAAAAQAYLDNATVQLSTRNSYRDSLNLYWLAQLSRLDLREIRFATLKRLDEAHAWTSEKTRQNAITALRAVFRYAMDHELADANPAERLRFRRYQKSGPDPYSMAERTALLAALEATHAALYFRVAFDTGMRTGELLALRWGDWDGESLRIVRSRVRRVDKDSTKTVNARRVLLSGSPAQRLLNEQRAQLGHLFVTQYGRPYKSAYHLNEAFRAAHATAGVRERTGPYPWRHTYATLGIAAGLPPAFLAKQLGHSLDVFFRRYATWISGDNDRALAEKLANSWDTKASGA